MAVLVLSFLQGRSGKKQESLNLMEAFALWDWLKSKYSIIESLKNYINDANDIDLKVIIKVLEKRIESYAQKLEGELRKYSIQAPDRNRIYINFPKNTEAVADEYIAGQTFLFLQEEIEVLLKQYRYCINNDGVRNLFKEALISYISDTDNIIRYLKLKGWIATPPLYKNTPQNVNEKISIIEAGSLWDHLTYRYDNIHTTEIICSYTHDLDFCAILKVGLKTLIKQTEILEIELKKFGISLPTRPSVLTKTPSDTEILQDDHMYRTILNGLQGAAILHLQPIKQCTFNDRIRKLFKILLIEEIDILNNLYKFGKMKGWFHPAPMYKP